MKLLLLLLSMGGCISAIERNDNIYVKGFYGNGYNDQRHSHIDYMKSYYGMEDEEEELETRIEEYCDDISDDE